MELIWWGGKDDGRIEVIDVSVVCVKGKVFKLDCRVWGIGFWSSWVLEDKKKLVDRGGKGVVCFR